MRIAHSVVKCVRSNGQGPICGAVKRSSNKNDGQNFLTPVAAVTTAPIGVTTPCGPSESLLGSERPRPSNPSLKGSSQVNGSITFTDSHATGSHHLL